MFPLCVIHSCNDASAPNLIKRNLGMNRNEIIRRSIRGVGVVMLATLGQFAIPLGSQIVLARLLAPEYFGMMAFASMVAMFFSKLTTIQSEKYLIKEKVGVDRKLNNAFTLELILASVFFGVVLIVAPILMKVVGKPHLTQLVQILAFSYFYNPFSKPRYLYERELKFFPSRFPQVAGQAVGAGTAISLALLDFGVWSLVCGRLAALLAEIPIIWSLAPVRPKLRFDKEIFTELIHYGWPLMGSSILIFFYWNVDNYIIGDLLGEQQLGYYWLAFQLSQYLLQGKTVINSVLLPAFSRSNDSQDVKKGFELATKMTAIAFLLPTIIVLVLGDPIIKFLFGEKWAPATFSFQIFMVLTALRATTQFWDPIFFWKGQTRVFLVLAIINSIIIPVLGYPMTLRFGIEGMAFSVLFSIMVITPIAAHYLKKIIEIKYRALLLKPVLIFLVTFFFCVLLKVFIQDTVAGFLTIAFAAIGLYSILCLLLFQNEVKKILWLIKQA